MMESRLLLFSSRRFFSSALSNPRVVHPEGLSLTLGFFADLPSRVVHPEGLSLTLDLLLLALDVDHDRFPLVLQVAIGWAGV